ncbi:MAG: UbiA family prenyltransferase [Anaerolineales bacterium]|jgi:1,4-dihydroxy-2-naphthoate octaprenyltransferase|nr:UbiA family prenyltransferase [Anaerolineales bacterium]
MNLRALQSFGRLMNPPFLLGGVLFYALGLSVLDYLGLPIDRGRLVLGLLLVLLVQLTAQFLSAFFDAHPPRPGSPEPEPASAPVQVLLPRKVALYAGVISGGLFAVLCSGLAVQGHGSWVSWLLLGLGFLIGFAYSLPPIKLVTRGYGELALSLGLAGLVPTYAFALQTGEPHRLVWLATAPLIALYFAMLLARRLRAFASDLARQRRTLLVRLGWEAGMRLHDGAILFAAILIAAGLAGGLPWRIGLGGLIVLPLAAAQVWQMRRIRAGNPPDWRNLTAGGIALVGLTTYFTFVGFLLS